MNTREKDSEDSGKYLHLNVALFFKQELTVYSEQESVFMTTGWTTQDIQNLLSEIKKNVPEEYRTRSYIAGMKCVQWGNVAFPPFSAEACQKKCREILQKVGLTGTEKALF